MLHKMKEQMKEQQLQLDREREQMTFEHDNILRE